MGKIDKPIRLGRGHTPLYVTICLTEKAWKRAIKGHSVQVEYPGRMHDASATHFPREGRFAPFTIICIKKRWIKKAEQALDLIAHEAVHCKQRCEELMQTTFDHESEAYYVQHIMGKAWHKIKRVMRK